MISSLCSVPEDMEIPSRTLTDNGLFFQNPKAAPPSGKSSICFESSTSPELIGLSTLFPSVRGSAHCQTESDITPSLGTSTTLKSDEADQPLSVKRSPTQPVTDGASIKTQPARFVDLDKDIQRKIFDQVLVRGEYHPYYRCGMLADGPWSAGYVDGKLTSASFRSKMSTCPFFKSTNTSTRRAPIFSIVRTISFSAKPTFAGGGFGTLASRTSLAFGPLV